MLLKKHRPMFRIQIEKCASGGLLQVCNFLPWRHIAVHVQHSLNDGSLQQLEFCFAHHVAQHNRPSSFEHLDSDRIRRALFDFEGGVKLDLPGKEFGGMWAASAIMSGEAVFEIMRESDVSLLRPVLASQDVNVKHSP